MRVVVVIPVLKGAGAEKFICNLIIELKKTNVDVHLYLIRGVFDEIGEMLLQKICEAGVPVYIGNGGNIHSLSEIFRFVQVCRKLEPDILFANLQISRFYVIIARLFLILSPIKLVHRIESTQFYGKHPKFLFKILDLFFVSTISIAPPVTQAYVKVVGKGALKKIHMIPNGSSEKSSWLTRSLPEKRRTITVLNVGRIGRNGFSFNGQPDDFRSAQKGHAVMIDALAKLKAKTSISKMKFHFIGDGDLKNYAENYAIKMNLGSSVVFFGKIDNVGKEMENADIFLFASRFEGMPNALIEAAQHGLPIIASDIPEIRWLAPKTGWILVDPEDVNGFAEALLKVSNNLKYYRNQAIKNTKHFLNEFSVNVAAKKYKKHLETVYNDD
ncbi:glycosyltransferase [Alphaproteobacteria bacterium]|nr:glycosyltransferase [Alphaproteobacteria bacterium]